MNTEHFKNTINKIHELVYKVDYDCDDYNLVEDLEKACKDLKIQIKRKPIMVEDINYREAAVHFINTAFCVLDTRKHAPKAYNPDETAWLDGDYGLKVNKAGRLYLVDPQGTTVAHSFNGLCSQITYIGKLLAVYLEELQQEYE